MSGYFEQSDPLLFSSQLGVVFPNSGLKLEGLISQGKITAVLPFAARAKTVFRQGVHQG